MLIVGDVHGKFDKYLEVTANTNFSVQVGDMGLDYTDLPVRPGHYFLGGNHDNYDEYFLRPDSLGSYGLRKVGNQEFFVVRGAESIDKDLRTFGVDWWTDEQLSYQHAMICLSQYADKKPDIVISHDCPPNISEQILKKSINRNITTILLSDMLEFHQPDLWIFGHHHKSFDQVIDGTRFVCLAELETLEI